MKVKYANYIPHCRNIGDQVQVYALDFIYERMGITKENVVYLTLENVCDLCRGEEHYILPLVSANAFYHILIKYLIQNHLENRFTFIPLSIGQTRTDFLTEDNLSKFRYIIDRFEMPIGCRDHDTALMYEHLGYSSYVNGCITNTLPRREDDNYDKVYLIDVHEMFQSHIPPMLLDKAVTLTQQIDANIPTEQQYKLCRKRYELLRDSARLVITCRYHVATPCFAMGIPVIMVENGNQDHHWTFDQRFSALNPHIPFLTEDQWSNAVIPTERDVVNFERAKEVMIELAISRIENAAKIAKLSAQLDNFYAPSKARFWDIFCKNRYKIAGYDLGFYLDRAFLSKITGDFKFYLYGLSDTYIDQNKCAMLTYIHQHYPNAEFLGFVDGKKTGAYFGKPVLSPEEMRIDADTFCLVSAFTVNDHVEKLFNKKNFDRTHLWKMPEELLFYIYQL